jgi:hypothetical protein
MSLVRLLRFLTLKYAFIHRPCLFYPEALAHQTNYEVANYSSSSFKTNISEGTQLQAIAIYELKAFIYTFDIFKVIKLVIQLGTNEALLTGG